MSDPDNGDTTLLWSSSRSTLDHHSTPDIVNLHASPSPSNVPSLANRQIQNYRNSNRSFTRPYSTKTVFFYKEGDIYFAGLRVPVSKARYRTIESLLDDLNSNISMPFGVRHLTTPRGKTIIKNIDQLQHHGRYIASSFKTPRPLNLSMVEKIQRIRQANRTHLPHYYRNNWFNYRKQNKNGRAKIPLKLSSDPATSKQVFFVLNGKPSRIYRTLLNPLRQRTIESLLEEVSEGLQMAIFKLYTYSGKRIINMDEIFLLNETRLLAVPRNERPMFRENIFPISIPQLPPISKMMSPSLLGQPTIAKQAVQSAYRENSIERPQRVVSNKMMPLTSMSRLSRRNSNESKNTPSGNKIKKFSLEATQHLPALSLSQKPPEVYEEETMLQNVEDCSDEVNELTANDNRREVSCGSKLTEPDNEKEAENVKESGRSEEENKASEKEEEEELVQNNEKNHGREERKASNTADTGQSDSVKKEVSELMFATSNDQAFDNNETSSSEANFSPTTKEDGMTYTVSVITGNRWAADTDLDLFIILYGDLNTSEKHLLRQDYINWLQTNEPKFQQNRMDSFHIETTKLGLLQKIIIGHDRTGYGVGVYIERVLVTENIADGRQYLFQCAKWLDSGQVDGKIERSLKTTAFCYLTTILHDSRSTSGRWELILHSGKDDGSGATTSNLNIVGYGSQGSSMTTKIYDNRMAKVPSASLVQVDFGEIGDLLKVRIEIDGNGEMPNYYLNYVELRDLDTEERMVSYVRKWLKTGCDEMNSQPFREFPVFRAAFEPLNILSYEGKIKLSSRKQRFLEKPIVYARILGEIGETGCFPVDFRCVSDLKQELSFKAEAVSVGRIQSTRLYVKMNDIGNEIYEGMQMLQDIYDRRHINVSMANDWIAEKVTVRESHHAPYRYVMAVNRVKSMEEENEKAKEDTCDDIGDLFVELLLSEMEGLSTKISKKKALSRKQPQWILSMTIGEGSTLVPKVTLCAENTSAEMTIVATTPIDMIITFQQKAADISTIIKVRVGIDDSQYLNCTSSDDLQFNDGNIIEIQKMKLYDSENGDELRFPAVNTILTLESVYEFPAVWPDIPPISNIVYIITINSGESSADFDVYITLNGTKGDTGLRKLINDDIDPFQEKKMSKFEVEAVSIGELLTTSIVIKNENHSFKWKCEQVHILDSETNLFYIFKFSKMFTDELKIQQVSASRLTDAL
uniref:Doublecortin family protein n=1 Tax=Wuchereria bancrofti TaxID=6293 RepID=A0AAF5Q1T5_WUCBA